MNPASLRDFVEITKGPSTSEKTLNIVTEVLAALGKGHEIVNDSPGFVINRVLMLAINEAIGVVEEQVASCRQVDNLFEKCLGHKTGPLATADLIGLDVIADSLIVLKTVLTMTYMSRSTCCGRKFHAESWVSRASKDFINIR